MFFIGFVISILLGYGVYRVVLYFVDKDMYSHFEIRNRMLEGAPLNMTRVELSEVLRSAQSYPEIQPIYAVEDKIVMKCYNWNWKELVNDDKAIVERIARSV